MKWAGAVLGVGWLLPAVLVAATEAPVVYQVDATAAANPFPHVWEQTFGSERGIVSLRESYRKDLREVKAATDFKAVRFHGIFNDETGFYKEDPSGRPVYNFTYIDQIYDGLLENGVRPFVELSFMPKTLAVQPLLHPFWYRPVIAPPKSYERWGDMIEVFARHLVERYGLEEVAGWNFEAWNEANLDFWGGEPKQETYFQLYAATARALKRVSPRLRIGGPVTAHVGWITPFLHYCQANHLPVDFVSTHIYADDPPEDAFGTKDLVPREEEIPRAIRQARRQMAAAGYEKTPLYVTEFNATYHRFVEITDSPYLGAWLAETIEKCDGLTQMMAYWTFSDVFEEMGPAERPFYGGFGLMATGNIRKPSLNALQLLHQLGTQRLTVPGNDDGILATRGEDGRVVVAIWNLGDPFSGGTDKNVRLHFLNLGPASSAQVSRVDRQHGSAVPAWEAMGRPDFPSMAQQQQLRAAGQLPPPVTMDLAAADTGRDLDISIPANGLVLVQVGSP